MNTTAWICPSPCTAISVRKTLNIACLAWLLALPAYAQAAAGRILFVHGDVRIISASSQERSAQKGEDLQEGDTIVTGKTGAAQVRMVDGGFIAVRPDTRLKVDTFRYAGKTDGSEKGLFTLTQGTFRAITGAVGKVNKDNYEVRTPGATIGIRGTDHEPMFIPVPLPGQIAAGTPGTYDKVNSGQAFIQTTAGTAFISANQAGFAAGLNAKPVRLPCIPDFYKPAPPPAQTSSTAEKSSQSSTSTQNTGKSSTASASGTADNSGSMDSNTTTTSTSSTSSSSTADTSGTTASLSTTNTTTTALAPTTTTTVTTQTISTSTTSGSVSLSTLGTTTHTAPLWSGGVGADMWINTTTNTKEAGSGAMIMDGVTGKDIQLGANNELISLSDVDPNGGSFLFSSGTATLTGTGSYQMTGPSNNPLATITWGRWNGGFTVVDHGTTKNSIGSFHYMYSPQVTTPTQWQSITASISYSNIPGIGAVTDQNGQLGNINSIYASVNFGNPSAANAVSVSLNASTPGLNWAVSGQMPLSNFIGGGSAAGTNTANILNGTCSGGTCSNAKGNISGLFIGTGAQGAITSFSLTGADASGNQVGAMHGVSALKCTSGC